MRQIYSLSQEQETECADLNLRTSSVGFMLFMKWQVNDI